jgi:hypothetical protein
MRGALACMRRLVVRCGPVTSRLLQRVPVHRMPVHTTTVRWNLKRMHFVLSLGRLAARGLP